MNLEEIKSGVAGLPEEQQDHPPAYLGHFRRQRDAGTRREITARIDTFEISPIESPIVAVHAAIVVEAKGKK